MVVQLRISQGTDGDEHQIIFSDTPGILQPAYQLQESMMDFVKSAFDDADILIMDNPSKLISGQDPQDAEDNAGMQPQEMHSTRYKLQPSVAPSHYL